MGLSWLDRSTSYWLLDFAGLPLPGKPIRLTWPDDHVPGIPGHVFWETPGGLPLFHQPGKEIKGAPLRLFSVLHRLAGFITCCNSAEGHATSKRTTWKRKIADFWTSLTMPIHDRTPPQKCSNKWVLVFQWHSVMSFYFGSNCLQNNEN